MNGKLFDNSKLAAYFLWEYTKGDNAMQLWYCAEDIAYFFEQNNLLEAPQVRKLIMLDVQDLPYINFIRNIAYRVYVYTGNEDALFNWFAAEHLVRNMAWCQAVINMACLFREMDSGVIAKIYSEDIKKYYNDANYIHHGIPIGP